MVKNRRGLRLPCLRVDYLIASQRARRVVGPQRPSTSILAFCWKAYSLDCDDGIERCALGFSLSPAEQYDATWSMRRLHTALSMLPTAQARRIVAYYFWGISKTDIAHRESVSSAAVGTRGVGYESALGGKILKHSNKGHEENPTSWPLRFEAIRQRKTT